MDKQGQEISKICWGDAGNGIKNALVMDCGGRSGVCSFLIRISGIGLQNQYSLEKAE